MEQARIHLVPHFLENLNPILRDVVRFYFTICRMAMRIYLAICQIAIHIYLATCRAFRDSIRLISNISLMTRRAVESTFLMVCRALTMVLGSIVNNINASLKAATSYLLAYLRRTLAIFLTYYRTIWNFDLPSWAAVKRSCFLPWDVLLKVLYLARLLCLVVLALSSILYRYDADFYIISTFYATVIKVEVFALLCIFNITYAIAVVCNIVGESFYKLADASTSFHAYLQFVVHEDSEPHWFMLTTAITILLCFIYIATCLDLPSRLVIFLISSTGSDPESPEAPTVHKDDKDDGATKVEENEPIQSPQDCPNIGEQIRNSEDVPPKKDQFDPDAVTPTEAASTIDADKTPTVSEHTRIAIDNIIARANKARLVTEISRIPETNSG